jgi:hypothetical protein
MASAFRSTWTCFLLTFVVLALCVGVFAQGGAGELTGQVSDSTGAVVSGVEVKLTNTATGEVRTTVTSPSGSYRFPALPIVGSYTLEVASKGFKSTKVQNIVASVGVITTRDVKLEIGTATEQVTVEAGTQLVQTEDASLSQNVDRKVWTEMPLEARSSNDFIGLLPGAEPAAQAGLTTDRGPAVNGTRSGSGNFMVEGFDNNDQGTGGGASAVMSQGGSNTTISPDAIEEYRVISGVPPAEYGKAGGFVTDTVLRGGTNQWHGSLFEYNRIQALAANSWFSNNAGQQDHLIRNQFGGSVGGPIVKDKTFFFFTAEIHRLRTSNPLTAKAYTDDFVNFVQSGAFEQFQESDTGQASPTGGICFILTGATCPGKLPGSATLGSVYNSLVAVQAPALCITSSAGCSSQTANAGGFYTGLVAPGFTPGGVPEQYPVNVYGTTTVGQGEIFNQARYSVKFDHKISSKDQLNVAFLYDNTDQTTPFGGGDKLLGPTQLFHGRAQNAGVTWTHTFSPTILNQARVDYVRHTGNFPDAPGLDSMPSVFSYFDASQVAFGNSSALPQFFTENEFVYKDDLSVSKGKNNFKFGAEYRRTRNGSSFDTVKNGLVVFQGVEDLVTDGTFTNELENNVLAPLHQSYGYGSITYSEASLNPTTGQLPVYYRGYRANEVGIYGQDDWRVTPRLTINAGLRWEYFGPPQNFQPGLDANFYQGTPVTPIPTTSTNPFFPVNSPYVALFASGAVQQRNHDLWNKDLNNFGPRFGFSWDALGNQKLVVRGGFGINYDRLYNNIFENIRFNPPFFAIGLLGAAVGEAPINEAQTAGIFTFPFTGTSTFASSPLTPSIRAMDQNLVTPYYEQAHFGFQYQVGKNMVIESNYVGTFGHKLTDIEGRNTFNGRLAGGDSTPINPNYSTIGFRTNCCDSNYHGWQTTLTKRFSGGLQFNANYTFSKAMDDVSDTFTTKNAGANAYPTDSFQPKLDYGPADFNVKHRVVASFVYDLPFMRANRWVGGWSVSGIVSVQTGANFSINNSAVDSNEDTQRNDRSVYIGAGSITSSINHNVSPATGYLPLSDQNTKLNSSFAALNTAQLPCPVTENGGAWCNQGEMQRNSLVGPGFFNTDVGFGKTFKINERMGLKIEGNFFNIFNHPNFLTPDSDLNDFTNFGKSLSTFNNQQSGGPRITQLAIRFDF